MFLFVMYTGKQILLGMPYFYRSPGPVPENGASLCRFPSKNLTKACAVCQRQYYKLFGGRKFHMMGFYFAMQ